MDNDFKDFFNWNRDYYKWIFPPDNRNIQNEWRLTVHSSLVISGSKEVMDNENGYYKSEI